MTQQSQNASLETVKRVFKKFLKLGTIGALGFSMGASFTACNKTGQTTTPTPDPDTKPPIEIPDKPTDPIEKTVSINKIYNDFFDGTSFVADIQSAQNTLADRVFDNLTPQIANIAYNEATKELTFDINYIENNKVKSGSMTFVAPAIFQQIRGKDAKALILEYAQLVATNEVKETSINEIKAKIEKAIEDIEEQIATGFANVKTSSITVEKEHDPIPVETISFDALIADELGKFLGKKELLQEPSKTALQQNFPDNQVLDNFKIAVENDKLIFYLNIITGSNQERLTASTYKGNASEFEDLVLMSTDINALLNKYFSNTLQNKTDIEIGSEEYKSIVAICANILVSVNGQMDKMSALNYKNFTNKELARHNNELSHEEAMKFALKLGYKEEEVLDVYITTPSRYGFDTEEYFNTGYMSGFQIDVLTIDYVLTHLVVNVPHYTDSTQADYYRYFLEGEKGVRYITRDKTSTNLNGIIADFANGKIDIQKLYAKVASTEQANIYLPLNLILDSLPR